MRKSITQIAGSCLASLCACTSSIACAQNDWTPQVSVDVRYIAGDTDAPDSWPMSGQAGQIVPSPDGRFFFFVTYRGEHVGNKTEGTIHLFRVKDVLDQLSKGSRQSRSTLRPISASIFSHDHSRRPALQSVSWEPDSKGILFQAAVTESSSEFWRIDPETGSAQMLARGKGLPVRSDYRGGTLAYTSIVSFGGSVHKECRGGYPGFWWDACLGPSVYNSFVSRDGTEYALPGLTLLSVAPDGQALAGYVKVGSTGSGKISYYGVARTGSPAIESLLQIRSGGPVGAYWSPDASHLLLTSAAHPTDTADHKPYVVDYGSLTGTYRVVGPIPTEIGGKAVVSTVPNLIDGGQGLAVELRQGGYAGPVVRTLRYRATPQGWFEDRTSLTPPSLYRASGTLRIGALTVRVKQNLNEPSTIVASDGRHEADLLAPDPALQGVTRSAVELIEWTLPDGKPARAGLVLPARRNMGERLPLVIQAYHFIPDLFLPDGEHQSIDSAQSLAARGFAVLLMDAWPPLGPDGTFCKGTACEGLQFLERVDSVVDELARRGVVDPDRVATTGFSRGGMLSLFAISHPGHVRLAATVIADAFTNSLPEYWITGTTNRKPEDGFYGGAFWSNKENWLAYDPIVNADKIETPALFIYNGIPFQSGVFSILRGAIMMNDKPVDMYFLPEAPHVIPRPLERIDAMNRTIDWLSYWLKGETDTDPRKADQYRRWAPLREQQRKIIDASASTDRPLPPLLELRRVTFWPDRSAAK